MKKTNMLLLLLLATAAGLSAQTPLLVVPTGHSGSIQSFMASADGKYFLTLGSDNLIKFWNEEGKEIRTIHTPDLKYQNLELSPDNSRILARGNYLENKIWILDAETGKEIATLEGHTQGVQHACWSPDGRMILTTSLDSTALVWDAVKGSILQRFTGHTGAVVSARFSHDSKQIATISQDQTAVIWDIKSGKLVRLFEASGKIPSDLEFSADGKVLATVTDWGDNGITLWSVKDAIPIKKLDGYSIRFSPDGKWTCIFRRGDGYLYSSDHLDGAPVRTFRATPPPSDGPMIMEAQGGYFTPDSKGLLLNAVGGAPEIYDVETGKLKFALKGYALPVQCASFTQQGEGIVVSSDNNLLLWNLSQSVLAKRILGMQGRISNTRITPDGQKIISVTDNYYGAVRDAATGQQIRELSTVYGIYPLQWYRNVLAISPDGQYYARGNTWGSYDGPPFLAIWKVASESRVDSMYGSFIAHDAAYSPDNKYLAVAASESLILWNFETQKWDSLAQDFMNRYESVVFLDNHRLATSNNGKIDFWNIATKKLISSDSISVSSYGRGIACSPDKKWFAATVSNSKIGLWRCDSGEVPRLIHLFEGHDNYVDFLDFSPDCRRLISASYDNTLRIWDIEKKVEIARIIHLNEQDWAVTTPSGLFDASPGAMELMYFIIGDEVIELEQLKERYYEPGLLSKVMGLASGELRNVEQFKNLALYPKIKAEVADNKLIIHLQAQNGGVGKLSLFVNGKEVEEDINPQRQTNLSIHLKTWEKYYRTDTLNTIALRAYNAEGWLKSQAYKLPYTYVRAKGQGDAGDAPTLGDAKPRLFALVVGTADYSGDKLDLKYADQDAASIAVAITAAGKELFGDGVQVQLFSTGIFGENATPANNQISSKTNIRRAFETLATEARNTDVLLLYFSGHGVTYGEAEKAQFYYLSKDIASEDLSDPEVRSNFTISSEELTEWIKKIPALKQVLILDACNSGKIVESLAAIGQKELNPSQVRALDRMKDRTGMFILTGSAANKVSYEASQFGQGLLTYSLLEGMSGLALAPDKRVDVMTLFQYSRDKVPEMAKSINGIQTPILAFPANGSSFDIGIVNEKVKIPLAQVKPVFIRNNFQDDDAFEDVLGLTDALEQQFRKMTSKGGPSKIIYVDVKEYENAYSMKGRYRIAGNAVEVRVRLFKGKTLVGEEFKVNGVKDDLPGLVRSIMSEVMGRI
ncbi:MAG: caspase family protein [Bacteroidetes bacterium]|nr:caspase family protein [Bacteroidota bacterium]